MAKSVIFNMAAAAILDLAGHQVYQLTQLWDLICGRCGKFSVNPFKNGRVIAV